MSLYELVVHARRAITPTGERSATVAVSRGIIAAIEPFGTDLAAARALRLADDEVLLPGMVDTHVHVNEPGRTEWEGFASATRAEAAGGVTTIVDMPLSSLPPSVDVPALRTKRAVAAEKSYVDVGFWGGAIPGNIDSLKGLHDYLTTIREFDGLMIVHAEDAGSIEHSPAVHGSRYAEFLASRPRGAENTAIAHVIEAARWTGARVHILHLSSSDALPMIASAERDGVRMTVETCLRYLVFDADEIAAGATQFKCCPPIREPENRELLWQGLADGIIDCIVSDHSALHPGAQAAGHRRLRGRLGRHRRVAGGAARRLDAGPGARLRPRRRRPLDVHDARGAGRAGPKGGLVVGRDADLAVFAPDGTFVVDAAELQHRDPIAAYAGRTLAGVVRSTWLRGQELVGEQIRGQLVSRTDVRPAPALLT